MELLNVTNLSKHELRLIAVKRGIKVKKKNTGKRQIFENFKEI